MTHLFFVLNALLWIIAAVAVWREYFMPRHAKPVTIKGHKRSCSVGRVMGSRRFRKK